MKISWRGLFNKTTPLRVRQFFNALLATGLFAQPFFVDKPGVRDVILWVVIGAKLFSTMIVEDDNAKPTDVH